MSTSTPSQIRRQLDEAEGYLMLEMPTYALRVLESRSEWPLMTFEANFLKGEALRCLNRHREALACLETAASLRPEDVAVALAQGWCYKRTNRLAEAVDALERASRQEPENSLIHYNLACYWSLAANTAKALEALATALRLKPEMRRMIAAEADFDFLRGDSAFERLLQDVTPSK
ncbi:TPR end-of-group domain-containing protein [Planctomyces sp. SH-PL62]|uniref:TPR end-of-group domain-containing protein n=1 Tax=Planctomyces sp. SH-PL62 TaxID=1636152 RepID=UPI00078D04CB|nr:tetratricopeptide repeat protein [Planctomyces sp. SH-PL62]AMV39610.1 Tetratricopeptide repeat protein [Planctomyces sp. SH-PL62]